MTQPSLFFATTEPECLASGLYVFRRFVPTGVLTQEIDAIAAAAPFRNMQVPGGGTMAVAMTNCGALGWVSSLSGYRYSELDPLSNQSWPTIPTIMLNYSTKAAALAGFVGFEADACLVNRYARGTGLGLHQDRDEATFNHPIVSVSLGASATFLWGGATRSAPVSKVVLHDGDVIVWGGSARLNFHGVAILPKLVGTQLRYNLTLRKAGA